jgi:hypothetical protein
MDTFRVWNQQQKARFIVELISELTVSAGFVFTNGEGETDKDLLRVAESIPTIPPRRSAPEAAATTATPGPGPTMSADPMR